MTERNDTVYAPLLDRYELVKTAILMIDEGIEYHASMILADNPEEDIHELRRNLSQLRSESYINMLYTFVLDEEEARHMIRLLALENAEM